jgi:hypothetical protein
MEGQSNTLRINIILLNTINIYVHLIIIYMAIHKLYINYYVLCLTVYSPLSALAFSAYCIFTVSVSTNIQNTVAWE